MMQPRSPSAQNEAGGVQSREEVAIEPTPLFDGPGPALWVGFGAFLLIFLLGLMLIIRGRVTRPAKRKAEQNANFFEPAGDDAEITFEDERRREPSADKVQPEISSEPHDNENSNDQLLDETDPAPTTEKKPKKSRFASLFSNKKEETPPDRLEADDMFANDAGEEFNAIPETKHWLSETPALHEMDDAVEQRRRAAEEEERQLERLALEEETRRHEEAERQRVREEEERRERLLTMEKERDAEFERRQKIEAEEARESTVHKMERSFAAASNILRADVERMNHDIGLSLEERFAALTHELHQRLDGVAARPSRASTAEDEEQPVVSEAYFAEFADLLAEQIAALRDSVNTNIEQLKRRIDALSAAPEGATALSKQIANLSRILGERPAGATAARIQLSDLLNSALPPERYLLSRKLPNNKTADAAVEATGLLKPIAIDAQFPVEAFDDYLRQRTEPGQGVKSENEFRRMVLRHVVNVAEKLIISGETADCAMLFVPSEHILSELHASFPDLVQESYRARVWLVSPTSLMATLHTISAVINASGLGASKADDNSLIHEITTLRERIDALEENTTHHTEHNAQQNFWENGGKAAHMPTDPAGAPIDEPPFEEARAEQASPSFDNYKSLSPEEEAFERLEREEALAEAAEQQQTEPPQGRSPFPLR